jgi:hypothetical protein
LTIAISNVPATELTYNEPIHPFANVRLSDDGVQNHPGADIVRLYTKLPNGQTSANLGQFVGAGITKDPFIAGAWDIYSPNLATEQQELHNATFIPAAGDPAIGQIDLSIQFSSVHAFTSANLTLLDVAPTDPWSRALASYQSHTEQPLPASFASADPFQHSPFSGAFWSHG